MPLEEQIITNTAWLRERHDLVAARLSYLLREQGIDVKSIICAKIFPSVQDPTGGVLITGQGKVFQFSFNRSGMLVESARLEEWLNITQTYMDHMWRDEILTGLTILNRNLPNHLHPGGGGGQKRNES